MVLSLLNQQPDCCHPNTVMNFPPVTSNQLSRKFRMTLSWLSCTIVVTPITWLTQWFLSGVWDINIIARKPSAGLSSHETVAALESLFERIGR